MPHRKYGMKIGGRHSWKYKTETWNEKKIGPRKWKIDFTQTKYRKGHRAPYGSGMPIGSRLHWKIVADQYAKKTGPNTYRLRMRGVKYQKGYSTRKRGKLRR